MNGIKTFLRSRVALLAILLVALSGVAGLLQPVQAAACVFRPIVTTYYSDATHTTVVGQCGLDCSCSEFCWGVQTQYRVNSRLCCTVNTC